MMDVQGCRLRIASVKMIDPSSRRGRLKFTAPELRPRRAFTQDGRSADDDDGGDSTDVCSSQPRGRACVQLAQWAELMA